jgi:hypothetical protein
MAKRSRGDKFRRSAFQSAVLIGTFLGVYLAVTPIWPGHVPLALSLIVATAVSVAARNVMFSE